MSKKNNLKIDKQLAYMRKQINLFLWQHYKVKVDFKLYANKELTKKRLYSETLFHEDRSKPIEVDIEYTILIKGKKQKILETAFREATRIGCYKLGRPYKNGASDFERELKKHGLPNYGGVSEMGKELHSYECSKCKQIWALKDKKMPKGKDPEQLGYLTGCCKEPFKYGGKKFYSNEVLQRIKRNLSK